VSALSGTLEKYDRRAQQ